MSSIKNFGTKSKHINRDVASFLGLNFVFSIIILYSSVGLNMEAAFGNPMEALQTPLPL